MKKIGKKRAVFLDYTGTIVRSENERLPYICQSIADASSRECTVLEVGYYWWKRLATLRTESVDERFRTRRDLERIALQDTLAHFNAELDMEQISQQLWRSSVSPKTFDDALAFFKEVSVPVYVMSNDDRTKIYGTQKQYQLPIKDIITSDDVRAYKPRREMFDRALAKHKLSAEEVLHIGDSLNSDVFGAQSAGIDAVWINRQHKQTASEPAPAAVVRRLTEAIHLLDSS